MAGFTYVTSDHRDDHEGFVPGEGSESPRCGSFMIMASWARWPGAGAVVDVECRWGRVEVDVQAVATPPALPLDVPMPIQQALAPDDLSAMQLLKVPDVWPPIDCPPAGAPAFQWPTVAASAK